MMLMSLQAGSEYSLRGDEALRFRRILVEKSERNEDLRVDIGDSGQGLVVRFFSGKE